MDRLRAGMMSGLSFDAGVERKMRYSAFTMHATKKGPGRSKGMKVTAPGKSGSKLARKAFEGTCGIRGNVGAAGRLALEGKLCASNIRLIVVLPRLRGLRKINANAANRTT